MSKFNLDAPVNFMVTSFTPVEHTFDSDSKVHIGGANLNKVIDALIKLPNGILKTVKIEALSADNMTVDFSNENIPENLMFFIILKGVNNSWYPVGPLMKLRE